MMEKEGSISAAVIFLACSLALVVLAFTGILGLAKIMCCRREPDGDRIALNI